MIKKIFIYLLLFVLLFCYSYFLGYFNSDEIWCYGFGYNISHGLVPYRDFNMVITPLLPFLGSLFTFLFGHHLWCVHILNSIMITFAIIIMYKDIGKKCFCLIPLLLVYLIYSYNLLAFLLIILIMYVFDSNFKNRELLLALLVSFMFLTKQHIGICMFIPLIICNKNKFKSFIAFMIPIIMLFIYLLINNAMYQFIDYCFLGLFDFGGNNSYYSYITILWIIEVIYFGYLVISSKLKNGLAFYILSFLVICIPIFDHYHFSFCLIIFLYYILRKYKFREYKYKYFIIMSCCYFLFIFVGSNVVSYFNINTNSNSFLYGRNVSNSMMNNIDSIRYYVDLNKDKYNIYIFSANAYIIKLELNMTLNQYDLINNGNMGYQGYKRIISNLINYCSTSDCLFILDKDMAGVQINNNIRNYVIDNYQYIEDIDNYKIYSNKVM